MLFYALLSFIAGAVVGSVAVSLWALWDQREQELNAPQ